MKLEPLEKLNIDLKEQGYKFSCVVWRSNFQVRGTFLLKDGSSKRKRVNLDIPADITRLSEARKRITELQLVIDQNQNVLPDILPWQKEFEVESKQIAVKEAKKLFIKNWWQNRKSDFEWWVVEDIDGNIIFDPEKKYAKKVSSFSELSFPWLSSEKLDYLDIPMIKVGEDKPYVSIDPRVAFMVSDILNEALIQNVKRRGLSMPISNMGGKTGTTNDATSTWFSGYASHIVASAWVGKDDGTSLGDNEFGSTNALPIWLDFMDYSKNKLSDYSIDIPEGIAAVRIDKESGKISQSFENSIFEYFLEENINTQLNSDSRNSDLKEILD